MKATIEKTLNIPVYEPHDTISFPSATLDVFRVSADNFGDGSAVSEMENVQVDLWFKDSVLVRSAAFELRDALAAEFDITFPDINFTFDNTARCYRANITFQKRR